MKNENRNILFIVLGVTGIFFTSLGSFVLFVYVIKSTFLESSIDTTNITSYGFAIFTGLAGVCFSWARNIDKTTHPIIYIEVQNSGVRSITGGILFLVASLQKFCVVHFVNLPKLDEAFDFSKFNSFLKFSLEISYIIFFALALFYAWYAMLGIAMAIVNPNQEGKKAN